MHIGKIIKRRRLALDLTQEQLATLAEVATSNVSRLERGRQNYTPDMLGVIAKALGTTASELLNESENDEARPRDPISARSAMEAEEREILRNYWKLGIKSRTALRQVAADMAANTENHSR